MARVTGIVVALAIVLAATGCAASMDQAFDKSAVAASNSAKAIAVLCHNPQAAKWARLKVSALQDAIGRAREGSRDALALDVVTDDLRETTGALLRCRQLAGEALTPEQENAAHLSGIGQELADLAQKAADCGAMGVAFTIGAADADLAEAENGNGVAGANLPVEVIKIRLQLDACASAQSQPVLASPSSQPRGATEAAVLPVYDIPAWCRSEMAAIGEQSYFAEKSCRDLEGSALASLRGNPVDADILEICERRMAELEQRSYWSLKSCIDLEAGAKQDLLR